MTINDQRFLMLLHRAMPNACEERRPPRSSTTRLVSWGIAVAATVCALFWGIPRLADPLARLTPVQWEAAFGQHVNEAFVQKTPMCRGEAGGAALQSLTERLAVTMPTGAPFTVRVHRSPVVNAFALPGGYIVVFQGLISAAQSPEEVAGVLAHEMAHQVQRHPLRGLVHAMGLRMVSGTVLGGFSAAAASGAHLGEVVFTLSYSRETETEADRVGVEMLNKADIRGEGLIDFFTRYQATDEVKSAHHGVKESVEDQLMSFLSTHPPGKERIAAIRALVRGKGDALTAKQWKALRTICDENTP
ncbi:MAG: M48 family metallopeptidase [Deltaproteobacteria bacterium]|nr:M48 family metallopeptidase [Deltaproteobacteria bacterium]